MNLIGVDVGGSKIEAALVSDWKILKKVKRKTEAEKGRGAVLKNIISAIEKVFDSSVSAIGIGIAGPVNPKKSVVVQSPHIPCLVNVPVKKILEKTFKVKVVLDNDARMFTLGAHKNYKAKNMVALTLGTGVGGAAILNNKLEKNPRKADEEIGHMVINKNGRRCACGARGCLEAYVSGEAIELRYERLTGKKASAKEIADAARKRDKTAEKVIKEARDYLAKGLSIIVEKYNPEIIVVGGGVSNIREIFPDSEVKLVKPKQNLALLGAALRAQSLLNIQYKIKGTEVKK